MVWYKNGKWHRDGDKPAIIYDKSATLMPHGMEWYKNDKCYRTGDQPAIIWENDSMCWYKNGSYHRVGDQPNWINRERVVWGNGNIV